ncbi:MAG TPA: hypothetical protein PLN52_07550, partial [Opitutaceae bacterium]|nr:hypothetical protein [Opitutaceae bacterium]
PASAESRALSQLYETALAGYRADDRQAAAWIENSRLSPVATPKVAEVAAWTAVANVLLNLDETLMKR